MTVYNFFNALGSCWVGTSPAQANDNKPTAAQHILQLAMQYSGKELTNQISAAGHNINNVTPEGDGNCALQLALCGAHGHADNNPAAARRFQAAFDALCACGADANLQDFKGNTTWHYVVRTNNVLAFKQLLKNDPTGFASDTPNTAGMTPLHVAAELGNHEMVELLLDHSASVRILCADNRTPRQVAAEAGHSDMANRLTIAERTPREYGNRSLDVYLGTTGPAAR